MSDTSNFNEDKPSSADSLETASETIKDKVSAGADAIRDVAAQAGERASEAYQRGNEVVASRIDPMVGIAVAAVAGFFVGYMMGSDHHRS